MGNLLREADTTAVGVTAGGDLYKTTKYTHGSVKINTHTHIQHIIWVTCYEKLVGRYDGDPRRAVELCRGPRTVPEPFPCGRTLASR
eukprot:2325366-Rhodomonas_salina.2